MTEFDRPKPDDATGNQPTRGGADVPPSHQNQPQLFNEPASGFTLPHPAEPGQSPADPPIYKTGMMEKVEERIGRPIESMLGELHAQGLSPQDMAKRLEVGTIAVVVWLEVFGIKPSTGGTRIDKIIAMTDLWRDRKEKMLARTQSREANKKRREAGKRRFGENPKRFRENIEIAQAAYQEAVAKRLENAFGPSTRTGLARMHLIEGLTREEIAQQTGYAANTLAHLMTVHNIPNSKPDQGWQKKNPHVRQILGALWSNPDALKILTPQERRIVELRHLGEGEIPSLGEIGKQLKITRERVRQLEDRAIQKLTVIQKNPRPNSPLLNPIL